jgi:hypothetical protein
VTRPGDTLNNNIRIIRSIQCCCCRMKGAATVRPAPTDSGRNVRHPSLRICTYWSTIERRNAVVSFRASDGTRFTTCVFAPFGPIFGVGALALLYRPPQPWPQLRPVQQAAESEHQRLRYAGIGPAYGPAQHPAPSPHPPASPIRAAAAAQMRTPTRRPPPPPARAGPRIRLPTPARRVHPSAH